MFVGCCGLCFVGCDFWGDLGCVVYLCDGDEVFVFVDD